jgi:hypothetical protein
MVVAMRFPARNRGGMEEENQGEKGGINFEAVLVSGRVGEGAVAMGNLPEIVVVLPV